MFSLLLALIYVCFISLGLPDSLLGSAWPIMQHDLNVPMSYAGIISVIIFIGTIISSFMSDWLVKKMSSGKITAISVFMTAIALFGFSISDRFWMLLLWAIPYGLGAGGVDAVLNNYVALHFKAQHMSWLHCFWGVGASISPYIMSYALVELENWSSGYRIVSIIQIVLSIIIFCSLPLWKKSVNNSSDSDTTSTAPLKLKDILSIRGAIPCFWMFFAYCAFELTTTLWTSTYLVESRGIDAETASAFASLFYIGITVGRAINGFLAMRFGDRALIRMGICITLVGLLAVLLPIGNEPALVGFIIMGLGCAPIYPCIIHMTPDVFGRDKSQAMIGFQMGFAYVGFCVMPPLFGIIAQNISTGLLPVYLLLLLIVMTLMHEIMIKKTSKNAD
ncbi:MAG: MFS transporter [Clostridiales bacterium]|nr:MFS transporter [Clostridiales bacterium]